VEGDDEARGAVYRDASGDIPLSRRPKEFLEFLPGKVVRRLETGADDRAHEVDRASWTDDGGRIAFRFGAADARGARSYEIVESEPDRLIITRR
jgi:hypothetical protein